MWCEIKADPTSEDVMSLGLQLSYLVEKYSELPEDVCETRAQNLYNQMLHTASLYAMVAIRHFQINHEGEAIPYAEAYAKVAGHAYESGFIVMHREEEKLH